MPFAHDSFFGWCNGFKRKNNTWGGNRIDERPPYPIIIADPSITDCMNHYNKADFGFTASLCLLGIFSNFSQKRFGLKLCLCI